MGVMIYPNGELLVSNHTNEGVPEDRAKKAVEAIAEMKDKWGDPVFKRDGYVLEFDYEMIEGLDPVQDYIEAPIKQAIEIAKQNGAYIEGYVDITSDWNDYDNIRIEVTEDGIRHANSEIANATTEELISELENRGYAVIKKGGRNNG